MTENEADKHRLPTAENRRIFRERIVPHLLAAAEPRQRPVVVFLLGQPGAGKARHSDALTDRFRQHGGCVDIDSDLHKPYHPDYQRFLAEDDTLMALYTRADGRAWVEQAKQYVSHNRLNAIVQDTAQNSAHTAEAMKAYRNDGYQVEALVLGVPQAMSNQGILARYHEQVLDRGSGRLTLQANADASYQGISELAARIDGEQLVHHVALYRRGEPEPGYTNQLDDQSQWERPAQLQASLAAERQRPWTEQEAAAFLDTQRHLAIASHGPPDWPQRVAAVTKQALPLLADTHANSQFTAARRLLNNH